MEFKANTAAFTPNHVGRVKVTINTTCEQDQTPQESKSGPFIDSCANSLSDDLRSTTLTA